MKSQTKKRLWSAYGLILTSMAAIAVVIMFGHIKPSNAAPLATCDPNGYLFKYPGGPTDVHKVDMVTGKDALAHTITGRQINAVGYNILDNHFYGWDDQNDVFVKISSDLLTVTPIPTIDSYTGPTSGVIVGDVDTNGHYWQLDGNTWHEIDLTQSPIKQVSTGTPASNPTGTAGADWAFVPDSGNLYRTMDSGGEVTVWAFSTANKTWAHVANLTNITAAGDRTIGANYADPKKHLYASSNGSGNVWLIDLTALIPNPGVPVNMTAVNIGTGNPSGSNDGARCAIATVPTDFGDAATSYDTLIADDGPRHNVIDFNIFNSTAPLMLGQKIDIENDGFPGADASGDDADHEGIQGGPFVDDERGVQHIVATPGSSDPLVVPVSVRNTSGSDATLVGWIDLDNDGSFEASERVTATIANNFSGYQQLTFPAPPAPYSTNTNARFRLFSSTDTSPAATGLLPTGPASSGEVEDVLVQVGTYSASKTANPTEGSTVDPGQTVTYTLTIKNTGPTALTNLKIDDDLTDVLDDATMQSGPTVDPPSAGTAVVSGNTLEFAGDVGIGQTITVTYAVKIKDGGTLGNASLQNTILAVHSANCHPDVTGGSASVSHPDCQTTHSVNGLANTGSSIVWPLLLAGGLLSLAGLVFYQHSRLRRLGDVRALGQK